jgi:hypothetical protein
MDKDVVVPGLVVASIIHHEHGEDSWKTLKDPTQQQERIRYGDFGYCFLTRIHGESPDQHDANFVRIRNQLPSAKASRITASIPPQRHGNNEKPDNDVRTVGGRSLPSSPKSIAKSQSIRLSLWSR